MKLAIVFASFLACVQSSRGDILYVSNRAGYVGTYDVGTGSTINAKFISGLGDAAGIALDSGRLYVANSGRVGVYNANTGAVINANFIPVGSSGIALDGKGHLFISNLTTVGMYDAMTGAAINKNFITGLGYASGIVADNSGRLYIADYFGSRIGVYDATTGATISSNFLNTTSSWTNGIALDNSNNLYVTRQSSNAIGKYNANTGATINASLITGLNLPTDVEADRFGYVYGVNLNANAISKYDAITGNVINANFITGLGTPNFMAIQPTQAMPAVPEPSSLILFGSVVASSFIAVRRRNSNQRT